MAIPVSARRVTEIWTNSGGGSSGSGHHLSNGLILTCGHVIRVPGKEPPTEIIARPLGLGASYQAELVWPKPEQLNDPAFPDAALVRIRNMPRVDATPCRIGPPLVLENDTQIRVSAIGFPAMRSSRAFRDTEEIYGLVPINTGVRYGKYDITDLTISSGRRLRTEPDWHGMSGAGLMSGGRLIGVLFAWKVEQRFDFGAVRVERLREFKEFRAAVQGFVKWENLDNDQQPSDPPDAVSVGGVTVAFTAEEVQALLDAATKGVDEKVREMSHQLELTLGAMRTMLAAVGRTGVPADKLAETLVEIFEQNRKAAAAIAALGADNPVAQAHLADAAQAQLHGDRDGAVRHVRAAREALALDKPLQHYSCFISYSSQDEDFVRRLHADLQGKGVRCWFAPEDMKIGAKILDTLHDVIQLRDKMVLVLSEASIASEWVEDEVTKAFEEERQRGTVVLFPVRLDDAVFTTREAWASKLRENRHIGDFRTWNDRDAYQRAIQRVLRDLEIETAPRAI